MKKIYLTILAILIQFSCVSKDKRQWKETLFPDLKLMNVFWINNQFIVSGSDKTGQMIYITSPDATSWTLHSTGVQANGLYLLNNQYIIDITKKGYLPSAPTSDILVSTDLVNWAHVYPNIYINHIIYDGYKYVATRLIWDHNGLSVDDPGNIATSIDLTNWSIHALADSKLDIFDLFYSNNLYFAIGYHDQTESIFTSTDGLDWKEIELFRGVPVSDMKYLNGEYIFVGPFGVIYTSPDGKKWINHSILFGPDFRTVARGPNDYLITATQKTTEIWTTSDWVSWKQDIYKEPTPGLKYWFTGTERSLFGINNGSIYVLAGFDCPDICTGFILTSP